jgi:hypothetical protein
LMNKTKSEILNANTSVCDIILHDLITCSFSFPQLQRLNFLESAVFFGTGPFHHCACISRWCNSSSDIFLIKFEFLTEMHDLKC